jgi:hypothetical protein
VIGRLIAYVFLGSFCIAGPLLLLVSLGTAVQRAVLVHSGLRADAIVIAKRQMASSRSSYAPLFQFTASDGRTYTVSSDVYGREADFSFGERVHVLYPQGRPQSARIDAFAQLWTSVLVTGVVGAGFSVVPAIVWVSWMRRRRIASGDVQGAQRLVDSAGAVTRWGLGLLLTGGGVVLIASGIAAIAPGAGSLRESRVFITSLGVLLAASGVLLGQWIVKGSRLYDALGGAVITSMAVIFGWVALYGESAGFSGGVSIGGAGMGSSGSATPARIAFGVASCLLALASLWAWKRVFSQRRQQEPCNE